MEQYNIILYLNSTSINISSSINTKTIIAIMWKINPKLIEKSLSDDTYSIKVDI